MIQCPRCGAENKPGETFCSECGARLTPGSSAAPGREPTSPNVTGDIPEEVPSWLQKLLTAHGLVELEEEEEELVFIKDRVTAPTVAKEPESWPVEEPAPLPEAEPEEWWPAGQKPGKELPPVEAEASEETGFTDWLRTFRSEGEDWEREAEKAKEIAPPEDEETSDWLRGLREPDVGAEGAPGLVELAVEPSDETGLEELPEWLRELGGPVVEAEPAAAAKEIPPLAEFPAISGIEEEEEELPEWLREIEKSEVAAEASISLDRSPDLEALAEEGEPSEPAFTVPEALAERIEEEEVEAPEWLRELQQMEPTPAEEVSGEAIAPPDWLVQPTATEVTIEADEVLAPDWLQEPVPSDAEAPGEEKELTPPDWLREWELRGGTVPEMEDEPAAEPPTAPVEGEAPPFVGEELEELAEILGPPVSKVPVVEPEKGPKGVEGLAQADIPDWLLALRPQEPGGELAEAREFMEFSGPLADIKGVLPVEPIISLPHLTRPEEVAVQAPSAPGDLFAEVVAQPALSASAVPTQDRARLLAGVQRILIYLLLVMAVAVPLWMEPIYGPLDATDLQAGGEYFYALLDGRGSVALPDDSVVIVAFDYNPATAAELALQARAILDHLMRRGVRIMAISLYPEGAALAWDVLDELLDERGYVYGENYVHLGYLPNQPAAVRYFLAAGPTGDGQTDYRHGQPISQYPIAQGVDDLSSVDLVVELAGDKDTLRTWVEQVTARAGVPVVAGVSAATAPYVQPYLDSGQLQALLVGLPGAAEYEAQAGQTGKAIDSLGSQVAAQAAIVLLILLGNLVQLVTRGGKE
jgi:hypothetical protein